MQQKTILGAVIVVVLVAGGVVAWNFTATSGVPTTTESPTSSTTASNNVTQTEWKSYTDSTTGFTFKYPAQYVVEASPLPPGDWGSRRLLMVDDNPDSTSTKARALPMTVDLQKQPVTADGKIYHTIAEYQQSGAAAEMMQGVTNPNGNIVSVNGTQALLYHIPPADSTGIGGDSYLFIHNDLIYQVGINPDNPLAIQMLNSINWQ